MNSIKQVIFDIFFSEKKEDDDEFATAVKEAGNVYMPYVFDMRLSQADANIPTAREFEIRLLKKLSSACKGTGHINAIPDLDGKVRRIAPFISLKDSLYPHIAFLGAIDYLGFSEHSAKLIPQKAILLGNKLKIPLDLRSNIIVNFPGKWTHTFRHYSYVDILTSYIAEREGRKPEFNLDELKDTVCFVGVTATAEPDIHPSPYESAYPGVGILASLFNGVISDNFITRASKVTNLFILILLGLIIFFATLKSKKFLSLFYLFAILFSFFLLGVALFALLNYWIDIFYPIIVSTVLYLLFTFKKYIAEKHRIEVIENELSIAKDIQRSFLPKAKPPIKGLEIEAKMLTALQVGGDLYDFIEISDTRAGIMIGDVSGKGVPAALYMAKVVSDFKSYAKEGDAKFALVKLNERLIAESSSSLFVTLTYLIFDMDKKTLNFSIGGHLPTIMFREGEEDPILLDLKEGMPLGLMEGEYIENTISMKKGDLFILYTDGVTEAMNAKHQLFGEKRLVDVARRNRALSVSGIVDAIHKEVEIYEGKLPQHDDITVIAVRMKE